MIRQRVKLHYGTRLTGEPSFSLDGDCGVPAKSLCGLKFVFAVPLVALYAHLWVRNLAIASRGYKEAENFQSLVLVVNLQNQIGAKGCTAKMLRRRQNVRVLSRLADAVVLPCTMVIESERTKQTLGLVLSLCLAAPNVDQT